jgi:membrane-associated phospholipid phosphatase
MITVLNLYSASPDSLTTVEKENGILFDNILPLSLIIIGSSISGSDLEKDIQRDIRKSAGSDFECKADDWLRFVPAAGIYIAKFSGVRSKNNFWDMSKNFVTANLISNGTVWGLKKIIDKKRPDGTEESFPSGHTNFAFTNAAIMYHEYKDSNQFWAYSGYIFATATGALRMMNNRHYISDVLAGAGIGILTANLVYRFEPLKNWHPFRMGAEKDISIFPHIGSDFYGISLVIEF